MKKITNLSHEDQERVTRIVLLAALADGKITDHERGLIWECLRELDEDQRVRVYRPILSLSIDPLDEVAALTTQESKRAAVKLALKLCSSDGKVKKSEQVFLDRLMEGVGKNKLAA